MRRPICFFAAAVLSWSGCLPTTPSPLSESTRVVWCGDGYVEGDEVCDDAVNDDSYGGCTPDCLDRAPYCGDGLLAVAEVCDDAVNDGRYGSCSYDCKTAMGWCGDGAVNGSEICDDGVNDGGYESCRSDCNAPGPRCGDGVRNGPERCDDGINDRSCGSCEADCSDYGVGRFLTQVRVSSIPDNYGSPLDFRPDMFVEITAVTGLEVVVTPVVDNTQPPVVWELDNIEVGDELLFVHVWDDDGGLFLGADDLGMVEFDTSMGSGTVSAGDLTLRVLVEDLRCDP